MLLPGDQELLLRVASHPDDAEARAVLADWLSDRGDPFGEFIRVQCALEPLQEDRTQPARRAALYLRERELLAANGQGWLERLVGFPAAARFRGGFPEALTADAEALVEGGLSVLAPVRALRVLRAGPVLGQLLALPWVRRLERLSLQDALGPEDPRRAFDDDFEPPWPVSALQLPPSVRRVGFDLLGRNTLGALARSGALAHVHTLELELNPGIAMQLEQLAEGRLPALRLLVLRAHRRVPRLGGLRDVLDGLLSAFPLLRVRWRGVEVDRDGLLRVDGPPRYAVPARVTDTGMPVFFAAAAQEVALPTQALPLTQGAAVDHGGDEGLRYARGRWGPHPVLLVEGARLVEDLLPLVERQRALAPHPHLARCLGFPDARVPRLCYGPLPRWRSLTELLSGLPSAAPRASGSTLGLPLPVGLRLVADLAAALEHLLQQDVEFAGLGLLSRDEVLLGEDGRTLLLPPLLRAEPGPAPRPLGVLLPPWMQGGPWGLLALLGSALVHLVGGESPEGDRDRDCFFQRPWLPSWFEPSLQDLDALVAGCLTRDLSAQHPTLAALGEALEGHPRTASHLQVADFLKQLPLPPSMA